MGRKFIWYVIIVLFTSLIYSTTSRAGEVKVISIRVKEPLAQLVELQGEGELIRNNGSDSYVINTPGIGFKKGDVFKLKAGSSSDYAIIALNKDGTSSVKLGPGAVITFLDDDGNFAITGVFVQSSLPSTYAQVLFDINHASPTNEFLVFTPDVVVGVRGTVFELEVGYQDEPTQVIGIEKDVGGVSIWNPNDLWIAVIDRSKVSVCGSCGSVPNYHNIKAIYDIYKPSLEAILKSLPSPSSLPSSFSLGTDPKKVFVSCAYKKLQVSSQVCTAGSCDMSVSPTEISSLCPSVSTTLKEEGYNLHYQGKEKRKKIKRKKHIKKMREIFKE